jgi:ABC-type bacteriocin/lantibiotic exporter with double-glycine peptidase domain
MSIGSLLAIQTFFLYIAEDLKWLGLYLRRLSQASIDLEDLYNMLNTEPAVKEK